MWKFDGSESHTYRNTTCKYIFLTDKALGLIELLTMTFFEKVQLLISKISTKGFDQIVVIRQCKVQYRK